MQGPGMPIDPGVGWGRQRAKPHDPGGIGRFLGADAEATIDGTPRIV